MPNTTSMRSALPGVGRCLTVLIGLCGAGASIPARADTTWEAILKLQLATEKKCDLGLILAVRQIPIEGLDALEGRVRCTDLREFDFSRPRPHMKFDLQLCQPTVC